MRTRYPGVGLDLLARNKKIPAFAGMTDVRALELENPDLREGQGSFIAGTQFKTGFYVLSSPCCLLIELYTVICFMSDFFVSVIIILEY